MSEITRVRITGWPVIYEGTTYQEGDEVDLPTRQAQRLIDRGKVVLADSPPSAQPPIESDREEDDGDEPLPRASRRPKKPPEKSDDQDLLTT